MTKIADIRLGSTLTDINGNLTSGGLARVSDAYYVNTAGVLVPSYGSRENLIHESDDITAGTGWWVDGAAANSTAIKFVADTDNSSHNKSKTGILSADTTYVLSAKIKAGAQPHFKLQTIMNPGAVVYATIFGVDIGDIANDSSPYSGIDPVDSDGYYRCWIAWTGVSGLVSSGIYLAPMTGANVGTFIGLNDPTTPESYIKNIQLEAIPSGNVVGPELIAKQVNRDFSGASDWTNAAPADDINAYDETGDLTITADGAGQFCTLATAEAPMSQNEWYSLEFDVANIASTWTISDFDAGFTIWTISANGTDQKIVFKYTDASSGGLRITSVDGSSSADLDNFSLKQLPDLALLEPSTFTATSGGTATIPAIPRFESEGLLIEGESTNLLLQSRNLDTSPWATSGLTPVQDETGIDAVANTAWTLEDDSAAAYETLQQSISIADDTEPYTMSCFIKKDTDETRFPFIQLNLSGGVLVFGRLWINTKTGASNSATGAVEASSVTSHGDWWKVSVTVVNTGAGNTTAILYVYPAGGTTIAVAATAATGSIIIDQIQFEKLPYPTSPIETLTCPVTRTSEAADGTYGYGWTMSATLKNILSNALPGGGATAALGTLVVEWVALQDYDAVNSAAIRGLVAVEDAADELLFFSATEGDIASNDDGTTHTLANINWSRADELITVLRWSSTANEFLISSSKDGTWTLNTGNESAFDGAFTLGTDLWLNYSNELPIHIKSITIYDTYLTDDQLSGGSYGRINRIIGTGMGGTFIS